MRRFETMEIAAAREHAMRGGQALHMMTGEWAKGWGGPQCFRRAKEFAHLFDQDTDRLTTTARRLGVNQVYVHKRGSSGQHVDLCGPPLRRAIAMASNRGAKGTKATEVLLINGPSYTQEQDMPLLAQTEGEG